MNKSKRDVIKGLALGSAWAAPVVSSVTLPAHATATFGAGCLQFTDSPQFVDFGGGNYIPSTADIFADSSCLRQQDGPIGCQGFVYAPEGIAQANEICQENTGTDAQEQGFLNDVYTCGCNPRSDIRVKTDVEKLGAADNGHQLYSFRYLNDESKMQYVGVMAQDLLDSHPGAVTTDAEGYYRVRYSDLGLRMATLDEWQLKGNEAITLSH